MIRSLKQTHGMRLLQRLEESKRNPELLREAIDQRMLDEMEKSLNNLQSIMSKPEFESLSTFHFGLQKAHTELSNVLAWGDTRSWAAQMLPKGFTALGRLALFTNGLTKLFKQLPQIVNVVKGRMTADRQDAWDPDKPLINLLDNDAIEKLAQIIIKAMQVPTLSFLSTGLPYINDSEAASELLTLTFNQLNSMNAAGQQLSRAVFGIDKIRDAIASQAKQAAQDNQDLSSDKPGTSKPVATPGTKAPGDKGKLVIPPLKPTTNQGVATGNASSTQAAGTASDEPDKTIPTVREMYDEIDNAFDATLLALFGEKGTKSQRFKEFKVPFIRALLKQMIDKKQIRKVARP